LLLLLTFAFGPIGCDQAKKRALQVHVLNRIGYGPDDWSWDRIRTLGVNGYIQEQLQPALLDDSALEQELAARYPTLSMDLISIRWTYHEYGAGNGGTSQPRRELSLAKLLRAVRSKRQLEQVLVDFWMNHFNVDAAVGYARWSIGPYERDAIRPHVLGRFEDMLMAVAKHPAMLDYLDNAMNFREGFRLNGSREYGINENYAREILELHTVGVDTPYTLQDIQDVARAFTGWTYDEILMKPNWGAVGFVYEDSAHDKGAKSIFGGALQIPAGGGIEDGEAVVRFLARHPRTAEHIARKLCQRFISEPPPENVVQQAKNVFLATDGNLREVMRTILLSPEFTATSVHGTKVKRPVAYVASMARAVGLVDDQAWANYALLEVKKMGETPYEAAPPTGYPEVSTAWVSQGGFLRRVNFAFRAADGQNGFKPLGPITGTSAEIVDILISRLMRRNVPPGVRNPLLAVVEQHSAATKVSQAAATLLASPTFMKH